MAKRTPLKPLKTIRPDRKRSAASRVGGVQETVVVRPDVARPIPMAPPPTAEGLALFEQGMAAFHSRQYKVAADRFQALITRFPGERALLDRTRVFLQLAERELNRRAVTPRTIEERLTAATAALNNDDDAQAESLVRTVLADEARHELALYLMAAIEARRGETDAALSFLGRAISVSPEVRAQARLDSDFELLRHLEAFQLLVDPPGAGSQRKPQIRRPFR